MQKREDYSVYIFTALMLTLAIIVVFQIYIFREPARIEFDLSESYQRSVAEGNELFNENCVSCHGENGEGDVGPALNSKPLLALASDEALFNLTSTGIPGTGMPAWNQTFGGPFTDENVSSIIAFIRAWEPKAPDLETLPNRLPDPMQGALIYMQTCFVCHGENGEGTDLAPAIKDESRLNKFEDSWYRQTISYGRPARGMPTWGTILSPDQIDDLVALISAWRDGTDVIAEIPYSRNMMNALYALRQFDREDAAYFLIAAVKVSEQSKMEGTQNILTLVDENRLFEAEAALISFLPPSEMGFALYESNCSSCHGSDGTGDSAPSLRENSFIQGIDSEELINFILNGRPGSAMNGFDGILFESDLVNLISLLQNWQGE